MAAHLETLLGVPVNVVNVTGGKGVTGHSRGLRARPDGYTLTTITLELNMLHWNTPAKFTYRDFEPLMSINEDSAALFVRRDAPWSDLQSLADAVRAKPGQLRASGTASGGAWHLALAGWLLSMNRDIHDITWVSSTGAGPSLQDLTKGGFDMVCCSLPEARVLLDAEEIRCLGVMAPTTVKDFPDVPTFKQQGFDWTLTGWRGIAAPKGTPPKVAQRLESAIRDVVTGKSRVAGQTFPEFMRRQAFDDTWRGPAEFRKFLAENDAKFGKLLQSEAFAQVSQQRFGPMFFPYLLMGLLGLVSVVWIGRTLCTEVTEPDVQQNAAPRPNVLNFLLVAAAVAGYVMLAPQAGFLITAGGELFLLLWIFGARLRNSALIAVLFVPSVYFVFAHLLRVPLPQGWLGW